MSVLPFELAGMFVAFVRVVDRVDSPPRFGIARRDGRTVRMRDELLSQD